MNQAGWRIYIPQTGKIVTSVDVAFDEQFASAGIAYNKLLFHDAMPTRGPGKGYVDNSRQQAHTGPPLGLSFSQFDNDDNLQLPEPLYEDDFPNVDVFEEGRDPYVITKTDQGHLLDHYYKDDPNRLFG
jgi:hypothetical protein